MAGIPVTGDQYFEIDGKLLEIKRQLRQSGGYPYDIKSLSVLLQDAIEGKLGPRVVIPPLIPGTIFRLRVDFRKSLTEMTAAGAYDHVEGPPEKCKFEGAGVMHFEGCLVGVKRVLARKEALKEIEVLDADNPWMPASIPHLLAFGAVFPEEQRKSKIYAIAVRPGVGPRVRIHWGSYLDQSARRRWLSVNSWIRDFYPGDRLLAVRALRDSRERLEAGESERLFREAQEWNQ